MNICKSLAGTRTLFAIGLITLAFSQTSQAASYTWDASGNGTTFDGSGVWSTTSANWYNAVDTDWTSANTAVFGAVAGTSQYTVTLGSNITAAGITFSNQNYTIAGGPSSYSITIGASGIAANASAQITAPVILSSPQTWTVASGKTLNVAGNVSGPDALTTSGGGIVNLAGTCTYTGITTVSAGTLQIGTGGVIAYSSAATGSQIDISGTSGTATMNVSGGSIQITDSNRAILVGVNAGQPGAFNLSAGTVNLYTAGGINIGSNGNGVWNQTGGLLTATNGDSNQTQLGNGSSSALGTMIVSGGTFNTPLSALYVGVRGSSTLTVSGNGYVNVGTLAIGENGGSTTSGTATLNSGGTIQTNSVQEQGGNSGAFLFNGGLLLAGTNTTSPWIPASTVATYYNYVQNGGAVIGPNGYNVTIAQPLLHYSGAMTDSLTVLGPGTVTLTGSNTYAGVTTISGGTLMIGSAGTSGSIGSTSGITDNGLLAFSRSDSYGGAFSPAISGTGGVTLGGGTLTLKGANTYSGNTIISSGALLAGAANVFSPSSAMTLNSGTLNVGAFGMQTVNAFTINGGSLAITLGGGALASEGLFTINGGTLDLLGTASAPSYTLLTFSNTAGIGPSALNFTAPAGYSLKWVTGATDALDLVAAQSAVTWNLSSGGSWNSAASWSPTTIPNGDGAWAVLGSALQTSDTVTLDAVQTLGKLTFSNSAASYTLAAGSSGALIFSNSTVGASSQIAVSAGTHFITAPIEITNDNLNVNASIGTNLTISGNISDDGLSRSLTLGGGGTLVLSGSNTYGGGTTVSAGILIDGAANSLGNGPLAVSGGTVNTNNPQSIASAALSAGLLTIGNATTLGSGTLTISGGSLDNISGAPTTLASNNPQTWTNSFTFVGSNPLNMGSGAVTMNASPTVTVSAGTLTEGGAISGGGALTVAGAGVLALAGNSGYSGGTTVHSGTLYDGATNSLGIGPLTLSGGTVNVNNPQSLSYVSLNTGLLTIGNSATLGNGVLLTSGGSLDNISGAPATLASNNPQIWTNSFTFVGSNPLNMGSGAVTMNASPTILVSAGTLTEGGAISGGGALTVTGNGLLNLTGICTYTGNTTVSGGTLQVGPGGAIEYSPSVTSSQINISGISGTPATMTLAGGSIQITDSNRAIEVGANTGQPGVFNISAGTLNLYTSGGINIGNYGNGVWNQTGGLVIASNGDSNQTQLGNLAGTGQMNVSGGTFSTPLSGLYVGVRVASSLTVSGNGYVNVGTLSIGENGGSTSSGTATLNGGTIQANSVQEQGGNTGAIYFNGGVLAAGTSAASPWIPASGLLNFYVQNGGAVFNDNGQIVTIAQPLLQYPGSAGGLSSSGSGDLILGGSNTYTGATTISSGTLGLGTYGSIAQSATISVANGATFDVSAQSNYHLTSGQTLTGTGNFAVNGAMTANSGSIILAPAPGQFRTLNVGGLTLSTGSVLNYDIGSGSQDLINVSGNLGGSGGGFNLYQGDGASQFSSTGTYELISYSGSVTLPTGALSVLNANPADAYTFTETGGSLNLSISVLNYWTGGSNGPFNWSNSSNWSSQTPVNGLPILFTGSVGLSNTNDITNLSLSGIAFDAAAGAFNISGNSIQFNGAITNGSTAAQTIGLKIGLLGNAVVNASAANILLNGTISDGGAGYGITTTGSSMVVLGAANTFSGATNITAGTLSLAHPLAVQNSTVNVNGGALSFAAAVTSPTLGGLSGSGNIALATAASEPVALNVGSNGQNSTYTGTLSGAGGLVKQGSGTLTLANTQSYGGATLISGGVLQLRAPANAGSAGIAIHFVGGGGSVSGPAGVTPLTNWNNLTGASVTNRALTDGSGAATTATITANALGVGLSNSSNPVLSGYIDDGGYNLLSATLNGIPYPQYSIYAYLVDSTAGYGEKYTVGGTSYYYDPTNSSSYIQIANTTPGSYPIGDYVLTSGLSGASQTLTVQGITDSFGSFAGFEIVNTTPNTPVLPVTTPVSISNGGMLDMTGQVQTIASLSSTDGSGSQILLGDGALTITGPAVTTFDGVISGSSGSLTVQGGGLHLTGNNTYTGGTYITGGSLYADGAYTLPSNTTVTLGSGLLDVTGAPQQIASLIATGGVLNVNVANMLTAFGFSTLGGTLNVYGTPSGSLIDLINLPNSYAGTFTPGVIPSGYSLSYANADQVDLVQASVNSSAWTSSLGGSWTGSSNWSSGVPSGQAVTALLGGALAASGTVTLDGPQTVGTLIFSNSAASYTLAGGDSGSLTLDNTGGAGGGLISVTAGSHYISAPVTLANTSATVSLTGSGTLDISGNIGDGGSGLSLTVSGDGTGLLSLDGSNTYNGGTYVSSGTLVLNGAAALLAGSSLTIGSAPGAGSVIDLAAAQAARSTPPSLAPVPEPGTLTLLMVCAVAVMLRFRRLKA